MTYARATVAGEDLKAGDVIIEKNSRGYCLREGDGTENWLGFARDDTPKGKLVTILPQLDLVGG